MRPQAVGHGRPGRTPISPAGLAGSQWQHYTFRFNSPACPCEHSLNLILFHELVSWRLAGREGEPAGSAGDNTGDREIQPPKDQSTAALGLLGRTRHPARQVACGMFMCLVAQLPNKPEGFWSIPVDRLPAVDVDLGQGAVLQA